MIRQPIVLIMGHVDHGKSSLLERIKGISITAKEAGGITQTIKSYNVPIETICACCGPLAESLKKVTIPGLLFLDSPGHFAFNNLRKRGGSLADIAIVVIDINEGLQPQTKECLEILKETKTPFIVALNKVDLVQGWIASAESLQQTLKILSPAAQQRLDKKLYDIVAQLFEYGFSADRFDRITDFTQNICLVPTSAKTGQGLGELLMLVAGLAQKYLEKSLNIKVDGPGKATVLEVTNEKGIGRCVDIILYEGELKVGDQVVMGTLAEPIVTKVKALFELEKNKLVQVKKVTAAYGVKLCAPNSENVIAGMPLIVANNSPTAESKKSVHRFRKQRLKLIVKESSLKQII